MADIQINTQVLLDTAQKVRDINAGLDEKLQNIKKEMNLLNSTWNSDGATAITNNMNALQPRFEEYKTIVESYAKFLVDTANLYEDTETKVESNANSFK